MTEPKHLKKFADSTLPIEKYAAEIQKFNEAMEPTIKAIQAHDFGIGRWAAEAQRTMAPLEGMVKASQYANETLARHSAAAVNLTQGFDAYRIAGAGLNDTMRSIADSFRVPTIGLNSALGELDHSMLHSPMIGLNSVLSKFDHSSLGSLAKSISSPDFGIAAKAQSQLNSWHSTVLAAEKFAIAPTINIASTLSSVLSDFIDIVDRPRIEPILHKARPTELILVSQSEPLPLLSDLRDQLISTPLEVLLKLVPEDFKDARGHISNALLFIVLQGIHNPRTSIVRSLFTALENIVYVLTGKEKFITAVAVLKENGTLDPYSAEIALLIYETVHSKDLGLRHTRHGSANRENPDYPISIFIVVVNQLIAVIHACFSPKN